MKILLGALAILVTAVGQVNCVCCCFCLSDFHENDCTCKHEGLCNGVGKCGIGCCNCDGGCWSDGGLPGVIEPKVRFTELDTDANGFITMEDIMASFNGTVWSDTVSAIKHFSAIDEDSDGKLSWHEFEKHA